MRLTILATCRTLATLLLATTLTGAPVDARASHPNEDLTPTTGSGRAGAIHLDPDTPDFLIPDAERDGDPADRVRMLKQTCLDCPAETVEYRAFDGTTYTMHRWPGRYVALLIPVTWPSPVELNAEQSRWLLDRLDLAYLHYRELIGRDPRGSGLLTVALVESTCGYGCGWIGSKGVEMLSEDWSIQHVIDSWQVDQVPDVLVHELGHNFDLYFDYLAYVQGHYHAWTAFIQTYVAASSRIGLHDVPPDEFLEVSVQDFRNARDQALFNWQECIRDGACPTVNDEAAWGGLSSYWAQLHDAGAVRGMFAFLEDYAAANPPPSGAEARCDLHIEAMAAGAGVDLSCAVDAWRWYASPEARTRMAQLYGAHAPLCDDLDGDGFSPAEDDCDDLNPGAYPGAAELANGIDDDCNSLVDDGLLIEPPGGDFPTPAMVTLPARIEGTVTLGSDVTDTIAFVVAEPGNYYLRICSTGDFDGWLALENPDETWYSAQHAGRGVCNGRIQYLDEGRTWRMEVFAAESGAYVVQAEPYGPWPVPPWSGLLDPVESNGSFTLTAAGAAFEGPPPTHTRFWVTGVGLVGEAPWSDPSSVVWTPDPNLDEGLYAFRAQPLTWGDPIVDMTPWRTFSIGAEPGDDELLHLRVTNLGAWQHLKLGYWPGNPWSPKLDPTGGGTATHVRISVKDFLGAAPWDKIALASPADSGHRVALGDYLAGDALDWTVVEVPLTAFPAGAFSNVSYLLLPSSSTDQTFQIGIARVEFVGGPTPFVWFGAPDKTDNSLAPSSDAIAVDLLEGDQAPMYDPAAIFDPPPGSMLPGQVVTFRWNDVGAAGYRLRTGRRPYSGRWTDATTTATEFTATTLPTDGTTIYVTLSTTFPDGVELHRVSTYVTAGGPVAAEVVSPTPGSTLTGSETTFTWTPGNGALRYHLSVLDAAESQVFWQGTYPFGTTSATASGLPVDGQALVLLIVTDFTDGTDGERRSSYTAFGAVQNVAAEVASPPPGSTLLGAETTFTWTPGTGVAHYSLSVLDAAESQVFWQGTFPSGTTSTTAYGLPVDGQELVLVLRSEFSDGTDAERRSSYTASTAQQEVAAELITPAPNSVLPGRRVTFSWTHPPGAISYMFILRDAAGRSLFGNGLYHEDTSLTFENLPTDGQTLDLELQTFSEGDVASRRYSFTAATEVSGGFEFFRISNSGGYRHFKLGYGTEHVWAPTISPAGDHTRLEITMRLDPHPDSQPFNLNKLWLMPDSDPSRAVRIGAWFDGEMSGWQTFWIGLSNFAGDWDDVTHFSLYSEDLPPFEIDLARVEFTGGSDPPFVWFGSPEKTDNAFLAAGSAGQLSAELFSEGAPDPVAVELLSPPEYTSLQETSQEFRWTVPIDALVFFDLGSSPGADDIWTWLHSSGDWKSTVSNLPTDGRRIYLRLTTVIDDQTAWNDYVFTAVGPDGPMVAELTSPSPGSALSGTDTTLEWTPFGVAVEVSIGSAQGGTDVLPPIRVAAPGSSLPVAGLPTDGRQLWVRLATQINASEWIERDFQLTAAGGGYQAPDIIWPEPGTVLPGAAVTFNWTDTAPRYYVAVGSTPGGSEYSASFRDTPNAHVTGLPLDGSTVYVRVGAGEGDDLATYAFTDATYTAWSDGGSVPTLGQFFRIKVNGGWGHVKLGHNSGSLWYPKIDPTVGGMDRIEITLRDVYGNADWDRLVLAPGGDTSADVRLGDSVVGRPTEWTTVGIPLSKFPAGAFQDITFISIFSAGATGGELMLARVAFRGPGGVSFVWFGDPEVVDNAFEDSAALDATREDGGQSPLTARSTIVTPLPDSRLGSPTVSFVWSHTGADAYRLRIGRAPDDWSIFDQDRGAALETTVGGLPADGGDLWVAVEARYGSLITSSLQHYLAAGP